jgi:hypothetical protein
LSISFKTDSSKKVPHISLCELVKYYKSHIE